MCKGRLPFGEYSAHFKGRPSVFGFSFPSVVRPFLCKCFALSSSFGFSPPFPIILTNQLKLFHGQILELAKNEPRMSLAPSFTPPPPFKALGIHLGNSVPFRTLNIISVAFYGQFSPSLPLLPISFLFLLFFCPFFPSVSPPPFFLAFCRVFPLLWVNANWGISWAVKGITNNMVHTGIGRWGGGRESPGRCAARGERIIPVALPRSSNASGTANNTFGTEQSMVNISADWWLRWCHFSVSFTL